MLLGGVSIFGGRGTIVGVVLAVAILGCLQTAMTLDLISAQDQNIVVGGLLIVSVIVPSAGDLYRRARIRLRSAEARRQPAAAQAETSAKVGVFGIGLAAYWPQFEGLRERLEGYQRGLEAQLGELGADVVSAGLVDTPQAAREAGETLAAARVELVHALHGDLRDLVAGAAGRAGGEGARRDPQPAADAVARLRGR